MVEDGESIDIIYTDCAKAFDFVPHQRLLEKVRNFGITGNVHNWIKSFLSQEVTSLRRSGAFILGVRQKWNTTRFCTWTNTVRYIY